jgi:hypothetical protein
MIEPYRSVIKRLRGAIKREDKEDATAAAELLLPIRDTIRIEAQAPVLYYRNDAATRSQCTAMSIHRLYIGQEKVGEWIRQSISGYGLDLNHPGTWAAMAINPALSRYEFVVKSVLKILGLEDDAPAIPEPK